jgi:DNA-binding MarR family transcriptional regulator
MNKTAGYERICAGAKHLPAIDSKAIKAFEAFVGLLESIDGIDAEMAHFFARFDLSQARFTVLMLLMADPPEEKTPAMLAEEAGLGRSSITELLHNLEHAGLVNRKDNPRKRSSVLIHLTERGRIMMEELLPKWFQLVSEMVRLLNTAEQTALTYLLQKARNTLSVLIEKRFRGGVRARTGNSGSKPAHAAGHPLRTARSQRLAAKSQRAALTVRKANRTTCIEHVTKESTP